MSKRLGSVRWCLVLSLAATSFCLGQSTKEAESIAKREFRQWDSDGNDKLTLSEILPRYFNEEKLTAERDFRVVDFDRNGSLSFTEFTRVPGIVSVPAERGKVPDPVSDTLRRGLKDWQERFRKADRDGDQKLSKTEWKATSWRGITPGLDGVQFEDWDANSDGSVVAGEVERLFDIAFGFRLATGELVRQQDDSFAINWIYVQNTDRDHDGQLSRDEVVTGFHLGAEGNAAAFRQMDRNRDGFASTAEVIDSQQFAGDTLVAFLSWDQNLDGLLDRDELLKNSEVWRRSMALRLIRAFDDDRDGKLSYAEFHGSPFSDSSSDWYSLRVDADHDGLLSWQEFLKEKPPRLIGLSRFYFDRFDLDHSGSLSLNELEFDYDSGLVPADVVFKAWDRSLDGTLSVAELLAFVPLPATDAATAARDQRFREYVKDWLKRADTDLDGRLSRAEFRESVSPFRPMVFDRFLNHDVDLDGRVSRDEYVRPILGTQWVAIAQVEAVRFDLDDDGFLSWKEFLVSPRGSSSADDRFFGLDTNDNQQLDLNEYLHIVPVEEHPGQRVYFFKLDFDGDGTVSKSEWLRKGKETPSVRSEFRIRDTNRDEFLSIDEFTQFDDKVWQAVRRRDFRVVDQNGDDRLTIDEFRCLPYFGRLEERGNVPDPVADLMQKNLDDLIRLLRERDRDADGRLTSTEWSQEKLRALSTDLGQIPFNEWDLDHNDQVEEQECRQVLEIAYGIRRLQGDILRTNYGRNADYLFYRQLDLDRDGTLTQQEFVSRFPKTPAENLALFAKLDLNSNGILEWSELLATPYLSADILNQFFEFDKSLDGQLDQVELDASLQSWQEPLRQRLIRAFDDDGDDRLSFKEFRLSPIANTLSDWYARRTDNDRDGKLSWTEFYAGVPGTVAETSPAFVALYGEYFRRFDRNHDGSLDRSEFDFTTQSAPISRIFRMASDESEIELVVDLGTLGVNSFGTPCLSPDGKWLAFDATPSEGLANNYRRTRIVTLALSGPDAGKIFDLGYGLQPTWSPDGQQLAFFNHAGNPNQDQQGIWISNADGTKRRHLTNRLITPRWSPDGKSLICTNAFNGTRNVILVDVESGEQRIALNGLTVEGAPVWDPKGDRIAVALQVDDHRSLCLIDIDGNSDSIVELTRFNVDQDAAAGHPGLKIVSDPDQTRPSWSQDREEILFGGITDGRMGLFRVGISGEKPATPIRTTSQFGADHGIWSHDRKTIYFCTTMDLENLPPFKNPNSPVANKTAEKTK